MSNKEFKKINESWDKFLNEELKELSEQEQIDEAIISTTLMVKLVYVLSQKENIRKVTQALLTRDDLPDSARKILETIDHAVTIVDQEMPSAARKAVELRGLAPDAWLSNMLTSIFARCISDTKCIEQDEEAPAEDELSPETPESKLPPWLKDELSKTTPEEP